MSSPPGEFLAIFGYESQAYAIKQKYPDSVVAAIEIITTLISYVKGDSAEFGRRIYELMKERLFLVDDASTSDDKELTPILNCISYSKKDVRTRATNLAIFYLELRAIRAADATYELYRWLEKKYQGVIEDEDEDQRRGSDVGVISKIHVHEEVNKPREKLKIPTKDESSEEYQIVNVRPSKTSDDKKVNSKVVSRSTKTEKIDRKGETVTVVRRVPAVKKKSPMKSSKSIKKK